MYLKIARIFAVLCIVMAAVMSGPPQLSNASIAPPGLPGGNIGLQFVRTVSDVDSLLSDSPSPDREAARIKLYQDYAFIPCYTGLCITLLLALGKRNVLFRRYAAIGIVTTIAAAVNDAFENLFLFDLVNLKLEAVESALLDAIRRSASTKWFFVAITAAMIGWGFVSAHRWQPRAAAWLCFAGALVIVVSLFEPVAIVVGAPLLAIGLLAAVATLKLLHPKQRT